MQNECGSRGTVKHQLWKEGMQVELLGNMVIITCLIMGSLFWCVLFLLSGEVHNQSLRDRCNTQLCVFVCLPTVCNKTAEKRASVQKKVHFLSCLKSASNFLISLMNQHVLHWH